MNQPLAFFALLGALYNIQPFSVETARKQRLADITSISWAVDAWYVIPNVVSDRLIRARLLTTFSFEAMNRRYLIRQLAGQRHLRRLPGKPIPKQPQRVVHRLEWLHSYDSFSVLHSAPSQLFQLHLCRAGRCLLNSPRIWSSSCRQQQRPRGWNDGYWH